ncbi:MAG: epoxyqueuosine reductase QueH [Lachnospiraceae bacterium]|nr:epoxyqueuosine reductase QueH [Lachnospiraceae bacterium]
MEQKINFQKRLDSLLEEIKESGKTPSLLLHSCCGPCSSYCLEYLKDYFQITVFYYNPNIYPEAEYELRLSEQKKLIDEAYGADVGLLSLPYDHQVFLEAAKGYESEPEGGLRCVKCFELRLNETARIAGEQGFDYFGTTLTVSPHKNAMILNKVGHEAENSNTVSAIWLESDFKKKNGYLRSIELSKQYDLYRQKYCGCEYSIY